MITDDMVSGVTSLLVRYTRASDEGDSAAWVGLFTDDGVFAYEDRALVGHGALADFLEGSARGVHVCGLPDITVEGDEVRCVSPFIFHAAGTGAVLSGYYHDLIDAAARPYRFKRREARVVGRTGSLR